MKYILEKEKKDNCFETMLRILIHDKTISKRIGEINTENTDLQDITKELVKILR